MKIDFTKIGCNPKPFELSLDSVDLKCTLKSLRDDTVALNGKISGKIDTHCDRCGRDYCLNLDSDLKLTLSDRVLSDKADLDIIEFLNGVVDINYILESEINAIKSTYHYCSDCEDSNEELIIEL